MKKQTLFISALAALIAVSCSKSEQGPGADGPSEYIKPTTSIAGTKALVADNNAVLTDIKFLHKLDAAGLTAPNISFAGLTEVSGSRAASGAITFSPSQPYDKVGAKTSYLLGYHPAGTLADNKVTWTNTGIVDILTTNSWDAGTYLAPKTTGMTFGHALARIEVICTSTSASDLGAVNETWGTISGIGFKDAPTTLVLDCANNSLAAGTTLANLALNSGNTYATVGFTAAAIAAEGSTDVMGSVMIPPTGAATCKLIIDSEKLPDMEVEVDFKDAVNVATTCQAGMVHRITLEFNAKDKTIEAKTTIIKEWTAGGTSEDAVTPPPPAIGDYYYSDDTWSTTYALPAGQTLLGVVYRVNPDGTCMLVDMTMSALIAWGPDNVTTGAGEDSGVDNTNIIKVLDPTLTNYPAFKYCEDKNTGGVTGWYLPAIKELRALYAGYSGLRWMASGANSANGEIDDWGDSNMPNNDTYVAARTAFNAKMTADGVGGTSLPGRYLSATEGSPYYCWYAIIETDCGSMNDVTKSYLAYKARCVKAITL